MPEMPIIKGWVAAEALPHHSPTPATKHNGPMPAASSSVDWFRKVCLALPHTTEAVQWGDHLVFKIAGKCFVIASFEPVGNYCSFKCSPDDFAELIERPSIIPAPYLARAQWVALETPDAMPRTELVKYLRKAYDHVVAKLPKKTRTALGG